MVHLLEQDFGTFKNEIVKKYTWQTKSGFKVSIISYGATIQSILVPDKVGELNDVVLGFDDINGYVERNEPYLGATVGRCANRIRGANFQIDGADYQLATKDFQKHIVKMYVNTLINVNWKSVVDGYKVTFSYLSKDAEEGYPGDLLTNVTYDVTDDDVINVQFIATSTKKTVINLTNHSYFNLAGHNTGAEEVYNHVISVNADRITETTPQSIPTGGFVNVGGTPFDLRIPIRLGDVMKQGQNLFHDNFCINTYGNKDLNFVSRVSHPRSGRYLEVYSDQPGVQLYTANFLPFPDQEALGRYLEVYSDQPGVQLYTANFLPFPDQEALVGKSGVGYRRHGAFCLETQNYPDAVHHPNFPSPILKPGDIYKHKVMYRFGTEKYNYPQVVSA
ncbi:Aldose 1-epimerase [Papilio machaon]|uniref:Aldose 1-epimerase n=1 Tax=Papilio machaon TaxID=76193 RepID=A0A0N1IEM2_PAPMA|nr:Aldose 1-epimerase [Papilio machaon]